MSYEECKRIVIQSVAQHIKQLFTVQTESDEESGEPSDVDMEDLSRAYGLLLQATASKSRLANTVAMQEICGKVYNIQYYVFVCARVRWCFYVVYVCMSVAIMSVKRKLSKN